MAARHRQPVEHSNTDSKDQDDLQEERNEELQGPQGSRQKLSTPSCYPTVTHRLPLQQGQDYLEDDYVCA